MEFAFRHKRWELESENVLETRLLDTLVPAIIKHVIQLTEYLAIINSALHQFLPLSRRKELLEYERDLRLRVDHVCRFIHGALFEQLLQFVQNSLHLIDVTQSRAASTHTLAECTQVVYRDAVLAAFRVNCVRRRIMPGLYDGWTAIQKIVEYYSQHPLSKADRDDEPFLASFFVAILNQGRPHTSQEEFNVLLDTIEKIKEESRQLYTSLDSLQRFLETLTELYRRDAFKVSWTENVDVDNLRERWALLEREMSPGMQLMASMEVSTSNLLPVLPW